MWLPKWVCIYCNKKWKMSKEHVIPTWIVNILKLNQKWLGYQRQKMWYTFDNQTIKTVCAECNNWALSQLDEYMKNFLLQNFNDKLLLKWKKTKITYDYHKLSRWLLKIICNSNEINKYDFELKWSLIKKNKSYILWKNINVDYFLYIEIIRDPYLLEINWYYNYQKQSIKEYKESSRVIKVSNLFTTDNWNLVFLWKMITIWEFIFYLFDKEKHSKVFIEDTLESMNIVYNELKVEYNNINAIIWNKTILDLFSQTYEWEKWLNFWKYYQDYKNKKPK